MVAASPFPSPRGSQVFIRELAEALARDGHVIHVVCYAVSPEWVPSEGVVVHPASRFRSGQYLYGPSFRRLGLDLLLLRELYRTVRRERIDLVHAHNYEAPLIAYGVRALTGAPVVYHAHNVMSDELPQYFGCRAARVAAQLAAWILDRTVPRWADAAIALSPRTEAWLRERGGRFGNLVVVPPGVTLEPADPEPPAEVLAPGKVIAYAGNLDPYQEVPLLLRAMVLVLRREPGARLVIVTHGPDTSVARAAEQLGVAQAVRVVVAQGFQEVRRWMRMAEVLVCPRRSWSGFPIKLLNYMAAGRPVIVGDGVASAVACSPLVRFPDGDPRGLAEAILGLFANRPEAAELGRKAREWVATRHAWCDIAARVTEVYDRVIQAGRVAQEPLRQCEKKLKKVPNWGLITRGGLSPDASRPTPE